MKKLKTKNLKESEFIRYIKQSCCLKGSMREIWNSTETIAYALYVHSNNFFS
jgi:hypothetical protein